MKLKDKVTIITGAGSGFGMSRGFPEGFAAEGSHLSLNYYEDRQSMERFADELRVTYGIDVILTPGDISSPETAEALIQNTIGRFGRIDILLNNAGISNPKPITEMNVDDWDRMIAVNLRSVFLTCKYAVPFMIKQQSGRIINIASQVGQKGSVEHCHYAASKAGMIGFTKSLAWELGKEGITVNCIAPGPINTQLMRAVTPEWRAKKLSELPLPRFGEVEEVIPSAIFLASEPGGNLYTGQTLGPNSGDVML